MTWYAIRTAPQRELAVEAMLRRKGYTVHLPTETKTRRAGGFKGKRKVVTYPKFTRYIFIKAPFSFLHLMAENHVSSVVGFDGSPAPITDEKFEAVLSMPSNVPHKHSVNPHRALRTGEMAEITSGPFQGQVVKVQGIYGAKARIFLSLFGNGKEVEILLDKLEAA